jgi:acetyltransferase-like isoleucine patch superfamily enzyme
MKPFRLYLYSQIVRWLPETRFFGFKVKLLRWCGATIGENVRICSSATFLGNCNLIIGNNVWIGPRCSFFPTGEGAIVIGDNVDFAPHVTMITGSHYVSVDAKQMAGAGWSKTIIIGDGCWLGTRSLVLPGVELASKTVVAAGSVVTTSNKEGKCLLAGVPATIKKHY